MTLNNLKLTSYIVDKFAKQVIPMPSMRINLNEVFSDKNILITNHSLNRLNERLNLNKDKMEYAQFIRSKIYGQKKIMASYKNYDIFIVDIAFGEVDITLIIKRQEKYYVLITAYINSTERFVKFMKEQFKKEEKEHEVDKILKESLFGGKSSAEFFMEFEKKNNLLHEPVHNYKYQNTSKTHKHKKVHELHIQELNEELMEKLLSEINLPEFDTVQIQKENSVKKYVKTKLKMDNEIYQQEYNQQYMDDLLSANTLVQQSVEDIVTIEEQETEQVIKDDDFETKIPEQKEVHRQELDEDLMNELLGDFAD